MCQQALALVSDVHALAAKVRSRVGGGGGGGSNGGANGGLTPRGTRRHVSLHATLFLFCLKALACCCAQARVV